MFCMFIGIFVEILPGADVIPFLGVPVGMTSKDVFVFFTKFGPVNFAKVLKAKHGHYYFAFVTFESRVTREAVLEAGEAELTLHNGRKLRVGAARRREIPSRTWFRRNRFPQPRDSAQAASVAQTAEAVQPLPVQYEGGAPHYQLPPAHLQVNLPGPQAAMTQLVPQYLLFNNNFTQDQLFFNHVTYPTTTNQEILNHVAYPTTTNQEIFNSMQYNHPTNQEIFNPMQYNHPTNQELLNSIVFNHPNDHQNQMFNSVTYPYPINQEIFLVYNHPTNQELFNSAVYYQPTVGMMSPQQQFPQKEVENPGNQVE